MPRAVSERLFILFKAHACAQKHLHRTKQVYIKTEATIVAPFSTRSFKKRVCAAGWAWQ